MKFFQHSEVNLIKHDVSDTDVALAAWVSNGLNTDERAGDTGKVQGLINYLMREHHDSPFEHGQFTFYIKTPIFVAREFMRHRTFSYNEISGRYSEMKPDFYIPAEDRPLIQQGKVGQYTFAPGDDGQVSLTRQTIMAASTLAWENYQTLKNDGVANEVARMVLPVNIMTEFYASVNPRNLMHFLGLRNADNALLEIREVAAMLETHLQDTMPMTHAAWTTYRR